MATANTARSYGSVERTLHWLTALLILTAIPLGLYASDLPYATGAELARKAQVFSLHKTVGVTAFFVALIRIVWALTQTRPAPIHPDRRAETALAEVAHWTLYISLMAVPLTGWITHASAAGFAPILWPFGQTLPLVPRSAAVETVAATLHWVFGKILIATILLHVAGALKHVVVDRDSTLARMWRGTPAPQTPRPHRAWVPAILAVLIYGTGAGVAMTLASTDASTRPPDRSAAVPAASPAAGDWTVQSGTLAISVRQLGSDVAGAFATWTADIAYDEAAGTGHVTVRIDVASLTLGSVSDQATAPEFLDEGAFPQAVFDADIAPEGDGRVAKGTLTLHGVEKPMTLPFTLAITGDTATVTGTTTLDRRDFGIGPAYPDEESVGFTTTITVDLTAMRKR